MPMRLTVVMAALACLAHGGTFVRLAAPDPSLDAVESPDPIERFSGNR
jgi:hypothetical protein